MSAIRVSTVVLRCDGEPSCDVVVEGVIGENTASVRERAKRRGWGYGERPGAVGVMGKSGQRTFDWCPTCGDPRGGAR